VQCEFICPKAKRKFRNKAYPPKLGIVSCLPANAQAKTQRQAGMLGFK